MGLLDIDVDNNDVVLDKLISMFFKIKLVRDNIDFELNFDYNISRIKNPELYHIYYDYKTIEPGTIYTKDGKKIVEFYIHKKYDEGTQFNYPLMSNGKILTLDDVYNDNL